MDLKIQVAEKDLEILKKEREILKLKLQLNDKFHGYSFKGVCYNKMSKHFGKSGLECAESIINQKDWNFDKLLIWVKEYSQGVYYEI